MRAGAGSGRRAAVAGLLLLLSACATRAASAPSSPAPSDRLVLQVRLVGGFLPVGVTSADLPVMTVYADGRVITETPDPAGTRPAVPGLQLRRIGADDVRALVRRALAAGVRDTGDLGRPSVIDAATTRFTVVDGTHTYVRDVYALVDTLPGGSGGSAGGTDGPDAQQQAARERLSGLYQALTDLDRALGTGHVRDAGSYTPDALAALVTTAHPGPDDPQEAPRSWPGPALPGESFAGQAGLTCLTATGAEATALRKAAAQADALTPWTGADGREWWVTFRPLLPHESGCADLAA